MYMRLVRAIAKSGTTSQLKELYENRFIPALGAIEGCLHISLLQSVSQPDEYLSMTLWRQRRHADDYESSGAFAKFVEAVAPLSAGATEYALHLGPDLSLQYDPVPEEPVIKAFDVPMNSPSAILPRDPRKSIFLRIVTPQIRDGMLDEFRKTYATEVLPAIRAFPGCLQAHLVENLKAGGQIISLSIWHNKQDAENYERSGMFTELTRKVEHCFTEMYMLKKQLGKESGGHSVTSEDMSVEGYNVVVGKNFM